MQKWKTNMWSSDCINTHSAIRKVSKREMKKWYMKERIKPRKIQPSSHLQKWSKETAAASPQVWENRSHVHMKSATILSLSSLNIRPTSVKVFSKEQLWNSFPALFSDWSFIQVFIKYPPRSTSELAPFTSNTNDFTKRREWNIYSQKAIVQISCFIYY